MFQKECGIAVSAVFSCRLVCRLRLALGSTLVASACLAILLSGCGSESVRESVAPPSTLSIIYSCDTRGHIEPCGCSSGQAGGISRRMTFLKEQAPGARLLVDVGDITAGPRNWEVFEMEYILKGYAAMGYHAVNVGHREISLGAEKLKAVGEKSELFISANVLDASGALLFPPYKVVTVEGGYRVGILGVTDENLAPEDQGEGLAVTPAADAVGKYLPEITPLADFIVLLAFVDEEAMKQLAERYFEIDVIVGGRVLQPTHSPVEVNQSRLVYITDKGKAVGKLDIAFGADGQATYTNAIHMLSDTMVEAPEITPIVDEFKVRLAEMDFQPHRDDDEGLTTITAARSGTANKYVSEAACVACHPKTVEAWKGFKHAHALESLAAKGHDSNPRCLQCHTVGYGATDGYVNQRLTPALGAVSCENCHGRGDHHVKFYNGEDIPERAAKMATIACVTCHDPENSPAFNYEIYWETIKHGKDRQHPYLRLRYRNCGKRLSRITGTTETTETTGTAGNKHPKIPAVPVVPAVSVVPRHSRHRPGRQKARHRVEDRLSRGHQAREGTEQARAH